MPPAVVTPNVDEAPDVEAVPVAGALYCPVKDAVPPGAMIADVPLTAMVIGVKVLF